MDVGQYLSLPFWGGNENSSRSLCLSFSLQIVVIAARDEFCMCRLSNAACAGVPQPEQPGGCRAGPGEDHGEQKADETPWIG